MIYGQAILSLSTVPKEWHVQPQVQQFPKSGMCNPEGAWADHEGASGKNCNSSFYASLKFQTSITAIFYTDLWCTLQQSCLFFGWNLTRLKTFIHPPRYIFIQFWWPSLRANTLPAQNSWKMDKISGNRQDVNTAQILAECAASATGWEEMDGLKSLVCLVELKGRAVLQHFVLMDGSFFIHFPFSSFYDFGKVVPDDLVPCVP